MSSDSQNKPINKKNGFNRIFELTNEQIVKINSMLPTGVELDFEENLKSEKFLENKHVDNNYNLTDKNKIEVNFFCKSIFQGFENKMRQLNFQANEFSHFEEKFKHFQFESDFDFSMEIRRSFTKIFRRSTPDSELYRKSIDLSDFFEELLKDSKRFREQAIKLDLEGKSDDKIVDLLKSQLKSEQQKEIPIYERQILGENLKKLNKENLMKAIKIFDCLFICDKISECYEIDLDRIEYEDFHRLRSFILDCLNKQVKEKLLNERYMIMKIDENLQEIKKIKKLKRDLTVNKNEEQISQNFLGHKKRNNKSGIIFENRSWNSINGDQ